MSGLNRTNEGDDLVFEEKIFGGAVPKNFSAVEKGLIESTEKGVLAAIPSWNQGDPRRRFIPHVDSSNGI